MGFLDELKRLTHPYEDEMEDDYDEKIKEMEEDYNEKINALKDEIESLKKENSNNNSQD